MNYKTFIGVVQQRKAEYDEQIKALKQNLDDMQLNQAEYGQSLQRIADDMRSQRDVWQDKATFYENSLKVCQNAGKRSARCTFLRFILIGFLVKCK